MTTKPKSLFLTKLAEHTPTVLQIIILVLLYFETVDKRLALLETQSNALSTQINLLQQRLDQTYVLMAEHTSNENENK